MRFTLILYVIATDKGHYHFINAVQDYSFYYASINPDRLGKVCFFLMGRTGESEERVISESEHQKGRVISHYKLFKGRVTHLFFMRIL